MRLPWRAFSIAMISFLSPFQTDAAFFTYQKECIYTYKISTNDLILSFSHRNDKNMTQNAKKTAYLSFLLEKVNKQKENVIFQTTQLDFF